MPRILSILLMALLATAGPSLAQEAPRTFRSPILTVDQNRLFEQSAYAQFLIDQLEVERDQLIVENRKIEADLAAEEQELTQERPLMKPEDFREKAASFDNRVVDIRRAQDEKLRDLNERHDNTQKQFYTAALPIIAELVRETGAVAVLESGSVILAAEQIDITQQVIDQIDARLMPTVQEQAQETPAPQDAQTRP